MRPTGTHPDQPLAQQIARRLVNSRRPEAGEHTAHAAAGACDQLYRDLSGWVGPDGCHAVFMRARAEALNEHPALAEVQLRARSDPYVDGVAETVTSHGDAATTEALEAMLVHLVELLSRLIGDDMAIRLIERTLAASERGDAPSDGTRREA